MEKKLAHKFTALDSLRGLAAIMVVFQHLWEMNHISDARLKPWLFFCAGHEAVILFFILSGFVLSHQLREFRLSNYLQFLRKRFLRIYPAYYFAIMVSMLLFIYLRSNDKLLVLHHGLTKWFYIWSQTKFDQTFFWGSITLITHQGNSLNVATWTLFYEVWISILFPLTLWLIFKTYWLISLFMVSLLAAISYWLWMNGILLDNSWAAIIYYLWYFIAGMTVYQYLPNLKGFSGNGFLIFGILLYFSNYLLFGKITSRLLHELIIGFGSCLLILNCVHNRSVAGFLDYSPFRYLGKISYSIYLLHLPLLYCLSYFFISVYGVAIVKLLTLVSVVLVASLSYYFIELKFINYSKKLNKVNKKT